MNDFDTQVEAWYRALGTKAPVDRWNYDHIVTEVDYIIDSGCIDPPGVAILMRRLEGLK